MDHKYPFLLLSILVLSLVSCKPGFDLALLQAPDRQSDPLPHLDFQMDAESFETLYPESFVEEDDGTGVYQIRPLPNTSLLDVKTIASRTLNQSICVPGGPSYGTANLKISSASVQHRAQGLILVSTITLFIANVVGMPIMKGEAIVELELEIYDANGERLNTYIGQGYDQQWIGLYYGGGDVKRKVHATAVQLAMQQIQVKIAKDVPSLKQIFAKVGAIQ